MITEPVTILVCRVGRLPSPEPLVPDIANPTRFQALGKLLQCNMIQELQIDEDLWLLCDEEARMFSKPLNRVLLVDRDGAIEIHAVYGDFAIARMALFGASQERELVDVHDCDWKKYLDAFEAEDIETARRMRESR